MRSRQLLLIAGINDLPPSGEAGKPETGGEREGRAPVGAEGASPATSRARPLCGSCASRGADARRGDTSWGATSHIPGRTTSEAAPGAGRARLCCCSFASLCLRGAWWLKRGAAPCLGRRPAEPSRLRSSQLLVSVAGRIPVRPSATAPPSPAVALAALRGPLAQRVPRGSHAGFSPRPGPHGTDPAHRGRSCRERGSRTCPSAWP